MKRKYWITRTSLPLLLVVGLLLNLSAQAPSAVVAQAEEQQANEPMIANETTATQPQAPDSTIAVDRTVGSAPCTYPTIAAALAAANPGDRLLLEGGVTFYEYVPINKNITIRGAYNGCGSGSTATTVIHGSNVNRVLNIGSNLTVTLEVLEITGGYTELVSAHGAGMFVGDNTDLTGSTLSFHHNSSAGRGGAVHIDGADVTFNNLSVYYNTAIGNGGGINVQSGNLTITDMFYIAHNTSYANGGALSFMVPGAYTLEATIADSHLESNYAAGNGGAIYMGAAAQVRLYANYFYELQVQFNSAGLDGGALYGNSGGLFDLYGDLLVTDNEAGGNGGVAYVGPGTKVWFNNYIDTFPAVRSNTAENGGVVYAASDAYVECDGALFYANNQATAGHGGVIYLDNSTLNADNCVMMQNQASNNGGAIAAFNISTLDISATYTGNWLSTEDFSPDNASILAEACSPYQIECSSFIENQAPTGYGGAIYLNNSTMIMDQTYLRSNSANYGGAIYQIGTGSSSIVSNTFIHHNTSGSTIGGAGIRNHSGDFRLVHVTLAYNQHGAGYVGPVFAVYQSIAWGNQYGGFMEEPTYESCSIDQSGYAGVNIDPLLYYPGYGHNYFLYPNSPAIDACGSGLSNSINNVPRPVGGGHDMGAYEILQDVIYLPLITR